MNMKTRKKMENRPLWVYSLSLFIILALASGATAATVSVEPSTVTVAEGETFTINVKINSGSENLYAAKVALNYDASKLELKSYTIGSLLGSPKLDAPYPDTDFETAGVAKYGVARTGSNIAAPVNGNFFTLVFQAKSGATGSSTLDLVDSSINLKSTSSTSISNPTVVDGQVTLGNGDDGNGGDGNSATVSVVPQSQEKAPGSTFTVNVKINTSSENLYAAKVALNYDVSKLELTSYTIGSLLGSPKLDAPYPDTDFGTAGVVKYGVARTGSNLAAPVNGNFLTLEFKVNDSATGSTTLDLVASSINLKSSSTTSISNPTVVDGQVNIVAVPDVPPTPTLTGWNWAFISVPYQLQNSGVSDVLSGVEYNALFGFDPVNKIYAGGVTNFTPLNGYLIHANFSKPTTLTIQRKTGQPSVPPSLDIVEGWNLVGTSSINPTKAETMLGAIDSAYYSIWNFNVSSQSYNIIGLNGDPVVDSEHIRTDEFTMMPGVSYWVWANEDAELPAYSP